MKKHIMIVDDDKKNLVAAEKILQKKYDVSVADSAGMAFELLEDSVPDLILLNAKMSEMDGLEIMDEIQSHPHGRNSSVIFFASDSEAKCEAECLRRGAFDFVRKPFQEDIIVERINKTLRMCEDRKELERMENMAKYDVDTAVYNRNSYFDYIHSHKTVEGNSMGCVFIDINGLHEFNNTYGHKLGDKMLEEIAAVLKDNFGSKSVYRIGGDEFIVFQENSKLEEIQLRMQNADDKISEKKYSISYGICWKDHDIDILEMVKKADELMYKAKKSYYSRKENNRRCVR